MASDFPNPDSQASNNPGPVSAPVEPDAIPPTAPVPQRKKRHPLRITIIAVVIVLFVAAVGFGVLRYFAPVLVTESFVSDSFSGKLLDSVNLICPAQQAQARKSAQLANAPAPNIKIDTSHLSFSIQKESLNSATVVIGGSISAGSVTTPVPVNYQVALQANGLWWCVSNITGGLAT
jgi:hypothetical protein